ncbi:hypothetical protein GCM10010398_57800 [Streptomyces fimbriatus]
MRAVAPHRELWKEARYRALFGVGGDDGPVPRRDHGPLPEGARRAPRTAAGRGRAPGPGH